MSILIQKDKCIGCRRCMESCPGNLLTADEQGKAYIRQERDCWGCTSCLKACPSGAIRFFLGADIGGLGAQMYVQSSESENIWTVCRLDGSREVITVNKKDANKY